jgi:processed acidic surface protein
MIVENLSSSVGSSVGTGGILVIRWKYALPIAMALVLALPAANAAAASQQTTKAAVRLEAALRGLGIPHVSLLFAYLESIHLTPAEINKIDANARQLKQIIGRVTSPNALTTAKKEEALRLFLNSTELLHLKVSFVTAGGQPVNLLTYKAHSGEHLLVQLRDEQGKWLATIHPHSYDIQAPVLVKMVQDVQAAAHAAKVIEHSSTFVPVPSGKLPVTATNTPLEILEGLLLVGLGLVAMKPLRRLALRIR